MQRAIFLLALLGTVGFALSQSAEKARPPCCGPNEHYESNSHTRQLTCDNMELGPIIGPNEPTTSACFCDGGYVRNRQGICIKRGNCPIKACPLNEHYEKESNRCQITCANMHLEPIMGPCGTNSACFCNNGYVRNEKGICVKRENCPSRCGPNEHYESNSHTRQLTCDNMELGPIIGPNEPTTSACFCDGGYVRNRQGICIKRGNCPIKACPLNEYYEKESNRCQISCATMHLEPIMGPCGTNSACFCNNGYVRNEKGISVKRENCLPQNQCGPNQVYKECGTACETRCADLDNPNLVCTDQCVAGCFCKDGYLKDDQGNCIPRNKCPLPVCTQPNEVATDCGSGCNDRNCDNYNSTDIFCPAVCIRGCFCTSGYVRNANGVCIQPDQCPKQCKKGEVYTDCGSSCPETCATRGDTCKVCTAQCVQGCFCAPGTVRTADGSCVKPENCPPRTCTGQNEEFVNCPPTCPKTEACSNIWSRFDCSNAPNCCTPSCRCKSGFYRNEQNVCISTQQCMNNSSGNDEDEATPAETDAEAAAEASS